jgi:putative DNA primase/helicase
LLARCHVGTCSWDDILAALRKRGLIDERRSSTAKRKSDGPHWRKLWDRSHRIAQGGGWTLAVDYLLGRGITIESLPANNALDVLRFCNVTWNTETNTKMPALIARVDREGAGMVAVHRVYLTPDGSKATLEKPKMALGPIKGGAIRLAPVGPNGELGVAEGIEDALSYMQIKGIPTWSAVAAGGIEQLVLPEEARVIYIALDKDPVGLKAAQNAARRWLGEGRRVFFAKPPHGKDWNDTLRSLARGGAAA